ncbi:MAG: DUF6036 family nucleotidyltransferase [bacterium]
MKPTPILKIEDILRILEQEKVKYAVIGGLAVVLYGYVRFTRDIDLVINFSKDNVKRFLKAMTILKFKPGPPVEPMDLADKQKRTAWINEKNAKVITFYNPEQQLLQIDILLTTELAQIKTVKRKIDDLEISVIDYEDLIEMKRQSGRSFDLIDIEKLEELKKM